KIVNEYQWRPMSGATLRKTVERYNSFVDAGVDGDFKKPTPMHKIAKPPFYAAWHTPAIHDSYTGIRINTTAQVLDLRGKIIQGLYASRRHGRRGRSGPARRLQGRRRQQAQDRQARRQDCAQGRRRGSDRDVGWEAADQTCQRRR